MLAKSKEYGYYSTMNCKLCSTPLEPEKLRRHAFYCSHRCRSEHVKQLYRLANPLRALRLATGTTGTIAELQVATDLMLRGYEVFRALSPSTSCDLAILKDGHLLRIEVRTVAARKNGEIVRQNNPKDAGRHDIFAAVCCGQIRYFPSLP